MMWSISLSKAFGPLEGFYYASQEEVDGKNEYEVFHKADNGERDV